MKEMPLFAFIQMSCHNGGIRISKRHNELNKVQKKLLKFKYLYFQRHMKRIVQIFYGK